MLAALLLVPRSRSAWARPPGVLRGCKEPTNALTRHGGTNSLKCRKERLHGVYAPDFSRSWSLLVVRTFVYLPTILLVYRPHHVCSTQALHAARASGQGAQALPQAMHALDHLARVRVRAGAGVGAWCRAGARVGSRAACAPSTT